MEDRGGLAGRLAALGLVLALIQGSPGVAQERARHFTPQERAAIVGTLRTSDEFEDGPPQVMDDGALRASLLRHATAMLGLQVRPASINAQWAIAPPMRYPERELDAALSTNALSGWLATLSPSDPRYRSLATWRCRYLAIVQAGGWSALPEGPTIAMGAQGLVVEDLRARLAIETGRPLEEGSGRVFDHALAQGLRDFQRRHGLVEDGVLGPATRRELNVSAEERLQQIDANIERWRWVRGLPLDRIEVDVASARATLYRGDVASLTMRVVVGDLSHRTPMFASRIESVVLNPPWNVPSSIAVAELYPREAAHPGYLARNHFVRVDGGLRQQPGPDNALGRLKFDMVSPFGVYLHDTPGVAAFSRDHRQLSHGCIRLEQPRQLALALLAGQGWSGQRIDSAIASGSTQRVPVAPGMPIYVLYWTAAVDDAGELEFRADPYGWDGELLRAMAVARYAASKSP